LKGLLISPDGKLTRLRGIRGYQSNHRPGDLCGVGWLEKALRLQFCHPREVLLQARIICLVVGQDHAIVETGVEESLALYPLLDVRVHLVRHASSTYTVSW
jgi:hypothetical protein